MTDKTYSRIQAERALLAAVNADPRVVAALEAKNTFLDSDAGKHLDAAIHGREAWSLVDEDLKDVLEAHLLNHVRTFREVKAELLTQIRSQQTLTDPSRD